MNRSNTSPTGKLRFAIKLVVLALLVFLPGCGVLTRQADPTRYFVLKADSKETLASRSGLAVMIGPVTIPGYLDHKEIVTEGPDNDLTLAEYQIWAETLDQAVSRVVATNVSRLIDSPVVFPFPDADARHDYKVAMVVRRFEMNADHRIHLEVSYTIQPAGRGGGPVTTHSRVVTTTVSQPENYASIVDGMSRALAELSSRVARDLLAAQ